MKVFRLLMLSLLSLTLCSCDFKLEWPPFQTKSEESGLSAYQIYLKYHPNYTGTEEEWANSLQPKIVYNYGIYEVKVPSSSVKEDYLVADKNFIYLVVSNDEVVSVNDAKEIVNLNYTYVSASGSYNAYYYANYNSWLVLREEITFVGDNMLTCSPSNNVVIFSESIYCVVGNGGYGVFKESIY